MIYPDWKYRLAEKCIRNKDTHTNTDVKNLISVLDGTCSNKEAVDLTLEAKRIYDSNAMSKEVLEGCLLCEDHNNYDISAITGFPHDLIEIYKLFFFDLQAFKYRIYKYDYVRNYKNPDFPDGQLYKKWALSTGIDFFRWQFKVTKDLVPKKVLVDLIGDTFFRAKEHINEPITSAVTRESLKWLKQASDSIGSLQKFDDDSSNDVQNHIRIALEYKDTRKHDIEISDAEIIM